MDQKISQKMKKKFNDKIFLSNNNNKNQIFKIPNIINNSLIFSNKKNDNSYNNYISSDILNDTIFSHDSCNIYSNDDHNS